MSNSYEQLFWKLFHESSKDIQKGHPYISPNSEEWPEEWKTVNLKTYPRFPKIPLPIIEPPSTDLFTVIRSRSSKRDFSGKAVTLEQLSTLLKYSCGMTNNSGEGVRRAQPSGGGRYPIEIYPLILQSSPELQSGVFHYNVSAHALDSLFPRTFEKSMIEDFFSYSWISEAAVAIVMTAVFPRSINKYGERGYRYVAFESGHIGQNIYLVCEALGLKCCAMGGTHDIQLEGLLDIDADVEMVIYSLIIGT